MASENDLVTVEEAGRALGVSVSTIWRRIRTGELPSLRRQGRRFIPRRALSKERGARIAGLPAFDEHHSIFRMVGSARSGGKAPGARDKHAILDE